MNIRHSTARWEGTLEAGKGTMSAESGFFDGLPYTRASRFAEEEGTNPEELIGAAHAGCYSQFLAGLLSKAGHDPNAIETSAEVKLVIQDEGGPAIASIGLETQVDAPGIEDSEFQDLAREAKDNCPVSKALAGTEITVTAKLI